MNDRLHPFVWLERSAETRAWALLGVATLVLSLLLGAAAPDLFNAEAPRGIVSYELAGSAQAAARILDSWDAAAQKQAMLSLGLDYLYLFVYSAFLSIWCLRTARNFDGPAPAAAQLGFALAWAVWLAAPLDGIENFALIRMLGDGPQDSWARVAWWCATPKFALVIAAFAYTVLGSIVYRLKFRGMEA